MQRRKNHWKQAKDHGIDMIHLAANLKKTPMQRVREHLRALALAEALYEAGKNHYVRLRRTA